VLATVMAIASQSLRNADSVEHGHEAIEHRLLALGRVHDLLLKTNWTSATLASIVQTAIEPFDKGERFSVEIPDIDVSPAAVLPLAMILNELCTNAVKYGAFSNASGCVAISAAVDASEERFSFAWVEAGGPQGDAADLPALFIVSQVELAPATGDTVQVKVERAAGAKCERCWKWSPRVGESAEHPTVCERCLAVITARA